MANPENLKGHEFKPGQSGNPGGLTREHHRLIRENAERATRLRAAVLAKVERMVDPEGGFADEITGEILKLLKDSEDRGLGAPQQTVEHKGRISSTPVSTEEWAARHNADEDDEL